MPYIDRKGRIYKYGEFFPIEFSPFSYNESLAYEEFPMTKEKVLREKYFWYETKEKNRNFVIKGEELPDDIKNVSNELTSKAISCTNKVDVFEKCTYAFRITPEELKFYKQMNLPLPRCCPNCRYYKRREFKKPWKLWHRQCMCGSINSPQATVDHGHTGQCLDEFETSYAPDRPEIVYCEKCYQQEVY